MSEPEFQLTPVTVNGQPFETLPENLYIPPDALEVVLEAFEGPLDLLLYLIRRENLDILNIPVAHVTAQYMGYIGMMNTLRFELAAEYLVMAAMLAEIKSRMLLPRPPEAEEEGEDPRAELIRRLQEYERFKQAAEDIDQLPRLEREMHAPAVQIPSPTQQQKQPDLDLKAVLLAFRDVLQRAEMFASHQIQRETLSVRERMTRVLNQLEGAKFLEFQAFFTVEEGRMGVVVTFLAILELVKEDLLELTQDSSDRANQPSTDSASSTNSPAAKSSQVYIRAASSSKRDTRDNPPRDVVDTGNSSNAIQASPA